MSEGGQWGGGEGGEQREDVSPGRVRTRSRRAIRLRGRVEAKRLGTPRRRGCSSEGSKPWLGHQINDMTAKQTRQTMECKIEKTVLSGVENVSVMGWTHSKQRGRREGRGRASSVERTQRGDKCGWGGGRAASKAKAQPLLFKLPTWFPVLFLAFLLRTVLKIKFILNQAISTPNRLRLSSSLCLALSFSVRSSSSPLLRNTHHSVPLSWNSLYVPRLMRIPNSPSLRSVDESSEIKCL